MDIPRATVNRSRRALLRGRRAPRPWLPWSDPDTLLDACTRCGACVEACPEQVITRGDGGFPRFDARLGECTFCATCVTVCAAPVFDRSRVEAWPLRARVAETCLERQGVVCRLCDDACPTRALRFRPRPGGHAEVAVDEQRCTGCGACVARCPPDAIQLIAAPRGKVATHA